MCITLTKGQEEGLRIAVERYKNKEKWTTIAGYAGTGKSTLVQYIVEELGLLEKTHTSSGRVPSEKGYRYYVDNLMEPKKMTGEDVLKLQTIFSNKSLDLNDAIIARLKAEKEYFGDFAPQKNLFKKYNI